MNRLKQLSLYIFLGLLAYMPLHIFLSTWLGTSFGILNFTKVAKDIVLVIGFSGVLIVSIRQKWFSGLLKDKLVWIIFLYVLLTLLLALIKPTDPGAEVLGVVYNTRFFMFFLYGVMLAHLYDSKWVIRRSLKVVLAVAVIVMTFGILQYTLLPNNALTHVGYSRENGVLPVFFIDNKPDLERVMSTLRDPNSFGSYTIIIATICLAGYLKTKKKNLKQFFAGLFILSILGLWLSFSRSALIGFMLSVFCIVWLYKSISLGVITKKKVLIGLGALIIMVAILLPLKNSYFVQNLVFHADKSTVLEDPNQLRSRFIRESISGIEKEPFGHGPGTAGLASIRNHIQGTTLNEDYYLQIGYEVGVIGLALFIVILAIVAWRLYLVQGDSVLALALLASFAGLAVTNLLVHIWSNEAVAYTFWGLAGLVIAKQPSVRNSITTKKPKRSYNTTNKQFIRGV